jgi:hypothetical protein
MIKTISREKTYIPKFDKNRESPSNEQIVVTYKAATIELKNRTVQRPVAVSNFDEAGKSQGMKIEVKMDDDAYVKNMLVGISGLGYQYEGSDEVKYIKNAQDLLKAPLCYEPLLTELVELFREELSAAALDEKN